MRSTCEQTAGSSSTGHIDSVLYCCTRYVSYYRSAASRILLCTHTSVCLCSRCSAATAVSDIVLYHFFGSRVHNGSLTLLLLNTEYKCTSTCRCKLVSVLRLPLFLLITVCCTLHGGKRVVCPVSTWLSFVLHVSYYIIYLCRMHHIIVSHHRGSRPIQQYSACFATVLWKRCRQRNCELHTDCCTRCCAAQRA